MKICQFKISLITITATLIAGVGLIPASVLSSVNPPVTDDTLAPGESVVYEKTVSLPEFPEKLDICLLVDLSRSYYDDLPNIGPQMDAVWDLVKADIPDVRWCIASFVDYPFPPWGYAETGDYAYDLDLNLTPNKTDFTNTLSGLFTRSGGDEPESQYEAVYQMATGAGRDLPPTGGSPGDVPAGLDPSWRDDATKVLIITTDAPFHVAGDAGPFPYPGPLAADAINALVTESIKVIALKAPGSGTEMDDLAVATGGTVQWTTDSSSDIGAAILAAFEELTFEVAGTPVGCDQLNIDLVPLVHSGVPGSETVYFDETITVPADASYVENPYCCEVVFMADDQEVGIQNICVTVRREILIDIKPGDRRNSISLRRSRGVIPVAILGSLEFDVADVDVSTLRFGPLGQVASHYEGGHYQDVNDDGYMDLVTHYIRGGTGIVSGDTEACLNGKTNDGIEFVGCDSVRTIN